ncbi:type II toxin-antitoxin system RelE/ParE family toxin [Acidobacteriota bacterium]
MVFIETPIFTDQIQKLLSDEEYRSLQRALLLRPEQGPLIKGSGGLRKVRWGAKGKGKRGGLRVIYYWHEEEEIFYMIFSYPKSAKDDLTPSQLKELSRIVRKEFK